MNKARQRGGKWENASQFAQVIDGMVTKIALVDPEYMAERPERYPGEWVDLRRGQGNNFRPCGIGWTRQGKNFVPPPEPEEMFVETRRVEPTPEQYAPARLSFWQRWKVAIWIAAGSAIGSIVYWLLAEVIDLF